MKEKKDDDQSDIDDKDDIQPDDGKQDDKDKPDDDAEDGDDFEPKLTAKQYAEKWRKASAEAAKYRKELATKKQEESKKAKEQLKEQGKYKEMYESSQAELGKLKGTIETVARSTAFKAEFLKQGGKPHLADAAEKLVSLSDIELSDSFRPDKEQVQFTLEQFREKYGQDFFSSEARPPKNGTPKKPAAKLTHAEWSKLPYDEKRKRMSEVADD